MKKSPANKKNLPTHNSDAEAEAFLERADLSEDDLSEMIPMRFELKAKDKVVNLRLPSQLLDAVKQRAQRAGIPYQRFIRLALERAVHEERS